MMKSNDADERELSLLRFALNKCNVDARAYHIGKLKRFDFMLKRLFRSFANAQTGKALSGVSSKSRNALGDERSKNDQLCLLSTDKDTWHVLYTERGLISQESEHSALNEAARDFFGRMTQGKAHWAFREEWEQSNS